MKNKPQKLRRSTLLIAGLAVIAGLLGSAVSSNAAQQTPVLVELFTSQGCYSCPAADDVLGELSERDDIIALAFHVTYWDRLGWPDTFGQEAFTDRQYDYAQTFKSRSVFTPQAIVAGEISIVGSSKERLEKAVDFVKREGQARAIGIAENGNVKLPELNIHSDLTVWSAAFTNGETVDIKRGENAGKILDYHRIVKRFDVLGLWDGGAGTYQLPIQDWQSDGMDGAVIVAQRQSDGQVLAIGQILF